MFLIENQNKAQYSIIKITYFEFIIAFSQPFRVGVHFDSDETPFFAFAAGTIITEGATADLIPSNEEFGEAPGGIIGSELISSKYWFVHIIFYINYKSIILCISSIYFFRIFIML